jgi:DNA-binding response OmpR family regulator
MNQPLDECILIVYDSPGIRDTIQLFDTHSCARLVEMDDLERAPEAIGEHDPAIVVLCALASNTIAYDLCRKIKSAEDVTYRPVVILALRDDEETRARAYGAGADDALQLSISAHDLLFHVRTLLHARRLVMEGRIAPARDAQLEYLQAQVRRLEARLADRDRKIAEMNSRIDKASVAR